MVSVACMGSYSITKHSTCACPLRCQVIMYYFIKRNKYRCIHKQDSKNDLS